MPLVLIVSDCGGVSAYYYTNEVIDERFYQMPTNAVKSQSMMSCGRSLRALFLTDVGLIWPRLEASRVLADSVLFGQCILESSKPHRITALATVLIK